MLFKNAVLEQHRFETQAGRRVGTECWLTFGAAVPARSPSLGHCRTSSVGKVAGGGALLACHTDELGVFTRFSSLCASRTRQERGRL